MIIAGIYDVKNSQKNVLSQKLISIVHSKNISNYQELQGDFFYLIAGNKNNSQFSSCNSV